MMRLTRDARWMVWLLCLGLCGWWLMGCEPSTEQSVPPPPPAVGSSQTPGKRGEVKAAPKTFPPVQRWQVKVDKKTPMIGNPDAYVTIVEFSDFQCPFCSKAGKQIKDLLKDPKLKDTVRVFFKHFPLSFHKDAHLAAQAAMAAHAQGKFWEMHDLLFANMKNLKRPSLDGFAKKLGLNMTKFKKALDKKTYKAFVDKNMDEGTAVKVSGTPTVFVNGRKTSLKDIKKTIENEMERNQALIDKGLKGDTLYDRLLSGAKLEEMKVVDIFVGDAPKLGDDDALVTVVAFGDFQCGTYKAGAATLPQLAEAYKGKVQVAFKHYPHHPLSKEAAQAAAAANEFGVFWKYYQKLIANANKLERDSLIDYAAEIGLDRDAFKSRIDRASVKAVIDADTKQAENKIGLKNTVGFYANGIKVDNPSFAGFKRIIDKILIKKGVKEADLPKGPPPAKIDISKAPVKGGKNAPITIVEYSDFQCPFCAKQLTTIRQITGAYKDKVKIAFKHFPLSFHKQAKNAAIASMAAHKQGKFWKYHDKLFQNYQQLKKGDQVLFQFARDLGLDMTRFQVDFQSPALKEQVEADMSDGARVGVSGTPAFYVNGVKLEAGGSFESLSKEINKILIKKGYKASELPKEPPPVEIKVGDSPYKGGKNAPVTIVEWSDFQCPFCGRAAKTVNQIAKAYKDKVKISFKQYPLSFHKDAHLAAQASLAAHAQGKFWQMHDLLFVSTRKLKRPNLDAYAQQLGLDMAKFKKALDEGTYKAKVDAEMAAGSEVGVSGTPTFFINNKKHKGGLKFAEIKKAIDAILLKKGYKRSDLPKGPALPKINIGSAPFKGGANAKVTIVEFSDFQCPFCGRAAKTLNEFAKAYGDKIKLVFKQYPLSFHKDAHLAAQAALAAHAQAKFWEMHDLLFANMKKLKKADLLGYAQQLSCDMSMFKAALDNGTYKGQVDADMRQGTAVGVSGTPTVFINNKKFEGRLGFEGLMKVVNPLLIRAGVPASSLPQAPPAVDIKIGKAATTGPTNAPVTIVEFSDFQCPFCSRVTRPIKQIKKIYKDKVQVVFKQFPLSFHKDAHLAAQAALAANAQGKFWEMHDLLFANMKNLKRPSLDAYAKKLGLNMPIFKLALDKGVYKDQVDAEMRQGSSVGVGGTPTIFINGRKFLPSVNFKNIQDFINKILVKKGYKASDLPQGPPPVKVTLRGDEPSKGPKSAPVTIIEFSDFQCPFCKRGANTIEKVVKAYGDKVRLLFKHYPLAFHKDAPLAAEASMAAQAQGKFWPMHDLLFANFRTLKRPKLDAFAKQIGLDMSQFKAALDKRVYRERMKQDMAEGSEVGVSGTPCFFINGQKVSGAQPFSKFQSVINKILIKKGYKAADLPQGPPPVEIQIGDAPFKGPTNAPVTIVEFSDFQCPFCSRGAKMMDEVAKAFPKRVKIVFKQFPLSFHKDAHLAAQAALAAHAQGKFWKMHDLLFRDLKKLKRPNLEAYAKQLGLDMSKFKAALDGGTYKARVNADMRQGGEVGVRGTPSFYVNGRAYNGRYNAAAFKQAINAELKRLGK